MTLDLAVYLVIGAQPAGERGLLATVRAARTGGVSAVQLRDKAASARELVALASALLDVLRGTGIPLLVNDRLDVALAAGATAFTWASPTSMWRAARRLAGPRFLIGLSVSRPRKSMRYTPCRPGPWTTSASARCSPPPRSRMPRRPSDSTLWPRLRNPHGPAVRRDRRHQPSQRAIGVGDRARRAGRRVGDLRRPRPSRRSRGSEEWPPMIVNALSIAGTDPSGGAGIQADLKTFSALGVYGTTVITALVAQNTTGVEAIHQVPADFVTAQLRNLFEDVRIDAVKIGMLGTADVIGEVAVALRRHRPPVHRAGPGHGRHQR